VSERAWFSVPLDTYIITETAINYTLVSDNHTKLRENAQKHEIHKNTKS